MNAIPRMLGDTRKARELLGFSAEVPLAEGLKRLVSWWRSAQTSIPISASITPDLQS